MFPKLIMTVLFVILGHSLLQVTLSSAMQCKDATRSIPDRVLAGHVFLSEPSPSAVACVILCDAHQPLCESINYYQNTKVCELNNKTVDSNPEDMKDYEWAIYMTNRARILSCNYSDFQCGGQTDICQIKPGGNKCKDCGEPLGMENRKIPDSALTASSFHRNGLDPRFAHLHSATSWSAGINNSSQWLQVDLGMETAIKKIATQSKRNSLHWVASYEILSRVDGGHWELYQEDNAVKVFQGNFETNTIVSHVFQQHIKARYVRILPQTWNVAIAMRIELYGCSLQ